jgi:hypothetical protein
MKDSIYQDIKADKIIALSNNYNNMQTKPVIMNRYMPDKNVINSEDIGHIVQPLFPQPEDNIYSKLTMLPGSHTAETCAMNAGLIDANQKFITEQYLSEGSIKEVEGLYLEIYNGYFYDDMTFFDKNSPIYTGICKQFDISNIMVDYKNNGGQINSNTLYTIRLTGHIIFDTIGKWRFYTNSDDSSLIWIGGKAIHTNMLDNVNLDNRGGDGMRLAVATYNVSENNVNQKIPFKLAMGNLGGPSNFILQYNSPTWGNKYVMNSTFNNKTYFKVFLQNNKPYYNAVYYALIGDQKTKNLNCGIYGDIESNTVQGFPQSMIPNADYSYLYNHIGNYQEVVAWEFIVPKATNLLNPGNSVHFSDNYGTSQFGTYISIGNLVVDIPSFGTIPITYTNNNVYIEARLNHNSANYGLTDSEADRYLANYPDLQNAFGNHRNSAREHYKTWGMNEGRIYTKDFTASIESNGILYIRDAKRCVVWSSVQVPNTSDSFENTQYAIQRIANSTFKSIVNDAVHNPKWQQLTKTAPNTLFSGQKLTLNGQNGGIPYLIDPTGRFMIRISDSGNLVLVITKKIKPRTFTEDGKTYKYTTYDDKSIFLNKVDAPSVMGKTFSIDKDASNNKQLFKVDTTSSFMSYDIPTTNNFTKYDTIYPTGINPSLDSKISSNECATKCSTNSDCMFYYSYNYKGNDYCQLSNANDAITFATKMDNNIASSALYVKNPTLLYSNEVGDAYNKDNKMQNIAGDNYKNNIFPISNIPYSMNDQEQITDATKQNQYINTQYSLTYNVASGVTSSGIMNSDTSQEIKSTKDVERQIANTNLNGGSRVAQTVQSSPQLANNDNFNNNGNNGNNENNNHENNNRKEYTYAKHPGEEGFTIRDGINDEEIEILNKLNILISNSSVPVLPSNVGSVGTIGAMSALDMKSQAKSYSNPQMLDLIGQDLVFYKFSEENNVGSYTTIGNNANYITPSSIDNINVKFLKIKNTDHPNLIGTGKDYISNNNSYLKIPKFIPLLSVESDHSSGLTFSFWFCSRYNKTYSRILDFGNGDGQNNIIIYVYDQCIGFCVYNQGYSYTNRLVGLGSNFNDWHYVCWTLSTDGIWNIFINGVLIQYVYTGDYVPSKKIDNNNVSGNGATFPNPTVTLNKCYIGKSNWWWDPYFNGGLSEFRIYNAKLSDKEIGYIYNTSLNKNGYNTNKIIKSLNRGIFLACEFSLNSQWHWGIQDLLYGFSRTADGSQCDMGHGIIQIYRKRTPGKKGKLGVKGSPAKIIQQRVIGKPGVTGSPAKIIKPEIKYDPGQPEIKDKFYQWYNNKQWHSYWTYKQYYKPRINYVPAVTKPAIPEIRAIPDIPEITKPAIPDIPAIPDTPDTPESYEVSESYIVKDNSISHGYCYKVDGNHFARINPLILPRNGITFSVWIKATPGENNNWARIFDFGNGQDKDNTVMAIYNDSIAIHVQHDSNYRSKVDNSLSNNYVQYRPDWYGVLKTSSQSQIKKIADKKWHHVVWTIDKPYNNQCQWIVYLDGVKQLPLMGTYPSEKKLENCYIGKSNWVYDPYLNGSISDFRIYSKVLNPEEVSTLYSIVNMNEGFTSSIEKIEGFSLLGGSSSFTSYREGYQYGESNPPTFQTFGKNNIIADSSDANVIMYGGTDFTYSDLQNNAIALGGLSYNYNKNISNIENEYLDISSNYDRYLDLYTTLNSNSRYLYKKDLSFNSLNDILNAEGRGTQDVLKNDVQEMILQENTIYTIGVITCATLIISALFISSKR